MKTRFEKFKEMTVEQLAEQINDSCADACKFCNVAESGRHHCGSREDCITGVVNWLNALEN